MGCLPLFLRIKRRYGIFLLAGSLVFCLLSPMPSSAQVSKRIDKVKAFFKDEYHSPTKAIVYSAILPGWGQAYNRKYWKLPIVYAGFAGVGYFIKVNSDYYNLFKSDYLLLKDDPNAQTESGFDQRTLKIYIDQYRRSRDLSIIALIGWYGLVMIDANVDAHFFNYDVDEDLSLKFEPWIGNPARAEQGIGITLNLILK